MPISSRTGEGLAEIGEVIQQKIIAEAWDAAESGGYAGITQRHRQTVSEAVANLASAAEKLSEKDNEIAAMFLRSAVENLSEIESKDIDEEILDSIFANFCIGK